VLRSVLVHYQELALKGRNRPWFVDRLKHNLRVATTGLDVVRVRVQMGRIEIVLGPSAGWDEVRERLETVCGIAHFSQAGRVSSDLDALGDAILADLGDRAPRSFRVRARRSDKRYPVPSPEIERQLGARIAVARGWLVELRAPDLTVQVDVFRDHAFYSFGRSRGVGGLPTGVSGRVTCLLSGGIDSPVAAWRMIRRGCRAQFVHFHGAPFQSGASQEKARDLARVLTRYQMRSRLYHVPFGEVQRRVVVTVPAPIRVVIYRRLMFRIAERLAAWEGAQALVSGEAVGQVASQTIENLVAIASAASMPVFRPLIGMDKEEVVAEARRLGTFDISIRPDEDCCRLFTPAHPLTRARREEVDAAEASLPLADLIELAVTGATVEGFKWPVVQSAVGRGSPRRSEPATKVTEAHTRVTKERMHMVFSSVEELAAAVAPVATIDGDAISVTGQAGPDLIDRLAHTAALGATPEVKGTARWVIRALAESRGVRPASIHDLYLAMGRGEAGGFTVPAMNIRMAAYNTARAAFRAAKKVSAGAFIFEIARSEIGYTDQRPHEYAAVVLAAALREGHEGPVFFQGDHVQVNAKKYASADRAKELDTLRTLIREEIAAGFYNIDIDTSTLVDLDKSDLDEQQAVNGDLCAEFTKYIREHEPKGITVSVGGEIGEVGGHNSTVEELHAFMRVYLKALAAKGTGLAGISKISVQTGTAHGGFVAADGKVRTDVKLDLVALEALSRLARTEYGLGGAVQHGASTLPPDAFDAFPKAGACEIHLATDFQNMVYEHPSFPAALKDEMYAWTREHASEERKPNDTEQQFLYKARKKAIGPFKPQLWNLEAGARDAVGASLEGRFSFLMDKLNIGGTAAAVAKHVTTPAPHLDRQAEIRWAAGIVTAEERKAEGLSD
jgi:tRNA sulfurtransferase ThiI